MIEYVRQILSSQFEASLSMVHQCVKACRPEHWEGKIANDTFRQVAYHTLFCTDMYLSISEDKFQPRDFHRIGGDERAPTISPGLSQEETLAYAILCRQKVGESLAIESIESLKGPSGFSWRQISRGELHIYNIRHIQHHAGQFSAYLRRVDGALRDPKALPWNGWGWTVE